VRQKNAFYKIPTQTSWKLQITCLRLPVRRTGRQAPNNKQTPNSNKRNPTPLIYQMCGVGKSELSSVENLDLM